MQARLLGFESLQIAKNQDSMAPPSLPPQTQTAWHYEGWTVTDNVKQYA